MITNGQSELFLTIYVIVLALCRLLTIALGIVVIFRKKGALRELGFFLTASGVFAVWSVFSSFLVRLSENVAVILNYVNSGVSLLSYSAFVLFFLYLRRAYKTRGLLYVCLFPSLWYLMVCLIRAFVFSKISVGSIRTAVIIVNLVMTIAPIAIWIFFTVICITNKSREKIVPRLDVWCILYAVFNLADALFYTFSGYLPGILNHAFAFLMSLLAPAFGIYLVVCLSRYVPKLKEV